MNMLRRFFLCIWSLVLISGAGVLGVCVFREDVARYWLRQSELMFFSGRYFWWLLLIAVCLLVLGIFCLFLSLARKAPPTQVVVSTGDGGQVNISLSAVENVVRKATLGVNGVKEVKSHLKPGRDGIGLGVGLEVIIPHDINVPETAAEVQQAVKSQLQTMVGLTVNEVTVLVSSVEGKTA